MTEPIPPTPGLPLTADERKEIREKLDALEKRETVTKADVAKIVQEVLDARDAKAKEKPEEAPAGDEDNDW